MTPSSLEVLGTVLFGCAILHTFLVKQFSAFALKFPEGSVGENFFHLLGEVEVVFGFWAALFMLGYGVLEGAKPAIHFLEGLSFTEPAFVFVIMAVCSTRPILEVVNRVINGVARGLKRVVPILSPGSAFYLSALVVGPLLGSLITEPAAMTVTALLLQKRVFEQKISDRLKYATLGLLFVNVSIGGTLTSFAAPPVLMVAGLWNWDLSFMLTHFGWKAALAILISSAGTLFWFRKELDQVQEDRSSGNASKTKLPPWVSIIHLLFLGVIVSVAHYSIVFGAVFLFFLGLQKVTQEYQNETSLREGLLVAFFLGGLVVLGKTQAWWLTPILTQLDQAPLFLGSMGLTAFTDNAALTYLGAQVEGLTEASRYALVAGAVVGGGLTVIANAPNPAGFQILNRTFGEEGISPSRLALGALPPTAIAAFCFWFL